MTSAEEARRIAGGGQTPLAFYEIAADAGCQRWALDEPRDVAVIANRSDRRR